MLQKMKKGDKVSTKGHIILIGKTFSVSSTFTLLKLKPKILTLLIEL